MSELETGHDNSMFCVSCGQDENSKGLTWVTVTIGSFKATICSMCERWITTNILTRGRVVMGMRESFMMGVPYREEKDE